MEPSSPTRLAELAASFAATGVWWAPSMNRWRDQTGTSHIIHDGAPLCGTPVFDMGGSTSRPINHPCRRCQHFLKEVNDYANANPDGGLRQG